LTEKKALVSPASREYGSVRTLQATNLDPAEGHVMKDPKTDIVPAHHLTFATYSSATAGVAVDMARHKFCLLSATVFRVATQIATIGLQDSDDGVTFATVVGSEFSEPIAADTAGTRFVYVRERDVRRYVRLAINPNGGTFSVAMTSLLMSAASPSAAATYSVDTSTL
jgi:hypothetical protein